MRKFVWSGLSLGLLIATTAPVVSAEPRANGPAKSALGSVSQRDDANSRSSETGKPVVGSISQRDVAKVNHLWAHVNGALSATAANPRENERGVRNLVNGEGARIAGTFTRVKAAKLLTDQAQTRTINGADAAAGEKPNRIQPAKAAAVRGLTRSGQASAAARAVTNTPARGDAVQSQQGDSGRASVVQPTTP